MTSLRLLAALLLPGLATAATYTVDNSADSALTDCLSAVAGDCSLRGALLRANADAAPDRIEFALPAGDPGYQAAGNYWRITVGATALPAIEQPVVIDGYSQPGAVPNTRTPDQGGLDAVPKIEIVPGTASASQQSGIEISLNFPNQAASTLRGLVISRFARQIQLGGTAAHAVEGCFLGTDILGSASAVAGSSGRGFGIFDLGGGPYRIGGTQPAARNLISGLFGGILLQQPSNGLTIQGNLIGTDASGTVAIPQTAYAAISTASAMTNARIGGDTSDARNVISGNTLGAIYLGGGSVVYTGTRIEGNYIGTDASGTVPLGNGFTSPPQPAIQVFGSGACGVTIGGDADGAPNQIAYNAGAGIAVIGCRGVSAAGNRFAGNRGLAIDLAGNGGTVPDGLTPNDAGDADEGSNRLQNSPRIEQIAYAGGAIVLTYRVDTAPANAAWPLRIDFARGAGAGVALDSYGLADAQTSKTVTFPASLAQGLPFALTATDADGNTSEFAGDGLFADSFGG
jgi:hypothetical protein